MFTRTRKYNDLVTFCFREQKRRQDTEYLADNLKKDVAFWQGQSSVYKERAERLEQELRHRSNNGQFSRLIPITRMEFTR